MPVLVTHPESEPARLLIERLARTGGQVRAYGAPQMPVADLRRLGVICAVGSLLDEGHLETAMEQVHTVVHAPPYPVVDDADLLVEEAATVVTAAVGAGVRRFVTTSVPGAADDAADPLRRAIGEAEQTVALTPCPSVVIRTSLVDTEALRSALARTPLVASTLDTPVAPVRADDLADLLFALDARRDALHDDHIVLAANGADAMSLRDYLDRCGVTPMSRVGRIVGRLGGTSLLDAALDGPWISEQLASAWQATGTAPAAITAPLASPPTAAADGDGPGGG